MPLLLLVWLSALVPPIDDVQQEADRRLAEAISYAETPRGAVALVALGELCDWLPMGGCEARLKRFLGRKGAPLVQAVAWGLGRREALKRLDAAGAEAARVALGLPAEFLVRPGPRSEARATLGRVIATDFGELWLEAWLSPARDAVATAEVWIGAPAEGPAVLRLGYDDQARAWLNGEPIFESDAAHQAALDQVAVPVILRQGDNLLEVEVRQQSGAWRLLARVTDGEGRALPVSLSATNAGTVPSPAPHQPQPEPRSLFAELQTAATVEQPSALDAALYARFAAYAHLPDDELALPLTSAEEAFSLSDRPSYLLTWLEMLPIDEQAAVRATHQPARPIEPGEVYAEKALWLASAWSHAYAQRHAEAQAALKRLGEGHRFLPALRLEAILLDDLALPHLAAKRLALANERWPGRPGLRRAWVAALRSAGRSAETLAALQAFAPQGSADDRLELATRLAAAGQTEAAVAELDAVIAVRPSLWTFAQEAAQILETAGERAAARARWQALWRAHPGEPSIALSLARNLSEAGEIPEALALLDEARAQVPDDPALDELRGQLKAAPPPAPLGPPLADLLQRSYQGPEEAVVLYHHAHASVAEDGRASRRIRRVVRVLTEAGARRFETWELAYAPSTQRLFIESAALVRSGTPPSPPRRSDRDLSEPEDRLYYDLRAEVLSFGRLKPGDVIDVAWRQDDTDPNPVFPGYYGELAYLQESVPRLQSVVEVTGRPLRRLVVPRGLTVTERGERVEAMDVPAIPNEGSGPGASTLRAYVHVSTTADWAEVDALYRALLARTTEPTDPLRRVAKAYVAGVGGEAEQLAALYTEVAHRTRYVGLEFGAHSFKPALPSSTLARGLGDCKDKAALMVALARALGLKAELALVRTRGAGALDPRTASFAVFDHAVVYLPGLDRFMDPTVDRNDPWTLPPNDQGAQALVVGEARLKVIPPEPASANVADWAFDGTVGAAGFRGQATYTTRGFPATQARRALEADGKRLMALEAELTQGFPGAKVQSVSLSGLLPARDPVVASLPLTLPLPKRGGRTQLALGLGLPSLVETFANEATRKTPLLLTVQQTWRRRLTATVAGSVTLPPAVALTSPFGQVQATATRDGARLNLAVEVRLTAFEIPPSAYPELRAWLASVDAALKGAVEVGP